MSDIDSNLIQSLANADPAYLAALSELAAAKLKRKMFAARSSEYSALKLRLDELSAKTTEAISPQTRILLVNSALGVNLDAFMAFLSSDCPVDYFGRYMDLSTSVSLLDQEIDDYLDATRNPVLYALRSTIEELKTKRKSMGFEVPEELLSRLGTLEASLSEAESDISLASEARQQLKSLKPELVARRATMYDDALDGKGGIPIDELLGHISYYEDQLESSAAKLMVTSEETLLDRLKILESKQAEFEQFIASVEHARQTNSSLLQECDEVAAKLAELERLNVSDAEIASLKGKVIQEHYFALVRAGRAATASPDEIVISDSDLVEAIESPASHQIVADEEPMPISRARSSNGYYAAKLAAVVGLIMAVVTIAVLSFSALFGRSKSESGILENTSLAKPPIVSISGRKAEAPVASESKSTPKKVTLVSTSTSSDAPIRLTPGVQISMVDPLPSQAQEVVFTDSDDSVISIKPTPKPVAKPATSKPAHKPVHNVRVRIPEPEQAQPRFGPVSDARRGPEPEMRQKYRDMVDRLGGPAIPRDIVGARTFGSRSMLCVR